MPRESRAVWEKRVAKWRESRLSLAEFAAEIGVNANTLKNWHYKLAASATAPSEAPPIQFVEVAPAPAVVEYEPIDVVLAGGARLRVPARFDEHGLRRLIAILERR